MKHELNITGSAAVRPARLTPTQEALTFRALSLSEFARLEALDERAVLKVTARHAATIKKKRQARWPIPCVDEHGTECYLVPLHQRQHSRALVEASDFWAIAETMTSSLWSMNLHRRINTAYVVVNMPATVTKARTTMSVARLILSPGSGEVVSYRNGDTFDLRRKNLVLSKIR